LDGGKFRGIDFGSLGGKVRHLWKQSADAGRCDEILVNTSQLNSPGLTTSSASLDGVDRKWLTLGGNSRSFAQVVKEARVEHWQMEGKNFQEGFRPYRGGRHWRGRGGRGFEDRQQQNQYQGGQKLG
jgi:hypothetical protein